MPMPRLPPEGSSGGNGSLPARLAAYESITGPVKFRIYFHGSQYGHQAGILGLRMAAFLAPGTYAHWAAAADWDGTDPSPGGDAIAS